MNPAKKFSSIRLVTMGLFTAIVTVVTMSFSVYVPATRGFFNIGDSMVFLSALLFGPFTGAFAGGVGSALADFLLGYSYYAPATLIIKGFEGFIVGWLNNKKPDLSKSNWRILTIILGALIGGLLGYFGITYYSGNIEIAFGSSLMMLKIPEFFWVSASILLFCLIFWFGWKNDPDIGWMIFSVIIGGCCMVFGYFLFQYFLIGPLFQIEVIAIAELPINLGQMVIGIAISLPLYKSVRRYLPFLRLP